jgi:hypothetical protein
MTASRQWTREELDAVHPLPDGWEWWECEDGRWSAFAYAGAEGGCHGDTVLVEDDTVCCRDGEDGKRYPPPWRVAVAVILASQGLDSREAMADALQVHVDEDASRLADVGPEDRTTGLVLAARANAAAAIVAMLRSGRVQP